MRRGFYNGMLTGGLIGAVVTMFVAPQFRKERQDMMQESRQTGHKAHRVIRGVKNMAEDWMK
jgi:gas vesicle protein